MSHDLLYNNQFFDYEIFDHKKLDAILDSSEYYDYDLGENNMDYIYVTGILVTCHILTENRLCLSTENGFCLIYT
jgi:hypothetical protein